MRSKVFLDTSYAIAIVSSKDDCLSFIVMRKQQITEALTADIHFQ